MATPTKWSKEFLVNTITASTQYDADIAGLADGRFIATWSHETDPFGSGNLDIHGQIFNADGSKAEAEFLVNTTVAMTQANSQVTGLTDGRFLVSWIGYSAGDIGNIYGQVFNPDGTRFGGEFQLNTDTAEEIGDVSITALSGGRFAAAWVWGQDGNETHDVRGQIFNFDGSKAGGEFTVNTFTLHDQYSPKVTELSGPDGKFVVTWETIDSVQATGSVHGQIFNSDGSKFGAEFLVSPANGSFAAVPDVTALANGGFVATWTVFGATGDVYGQVFNANGTKSGSAFLLNTTTIDNQSYATIAALNDGRFVAAWADDSQTGGDSSGDAIRAQVFNANGTKSGAEFLVNTTTLDIQHNPTITVLEDGRFVVGWDDNSHSPDDPDFGAIRGQIFDPRESAINLTGGALNDDWVGTKFADTMKGGGGDDHLLGGAGADTLIGNEGIDTASYANSPSAVAVNLATGIGAFGDAQGDTLGSIENLIGSDYNDTLIGDGGNNVFDPRAGGNTIEGGAGDDTVIMLTNFGDGYMTDWDGGILAGRGEYMNFMKDVEHVRFHDGTAVDVIPLLNDGSALFDSLYYMMANPDVFQAGANALDHFNTMGWHEGRNPNWYFDTTGYVAANKGVAASGMNLLDHYHQVGWHEGRDPSADFDTTLYLINNPDVAAAGVDPLEHYLRFGKVEGRQTYDAIGRQIVNGFDAEYYLFHNPDVAKAGADPLEHFNSIGWHEGRNPNAYFDTTGYLTHYADVAASGINPLQHYEQFGWHEGRDPSKSFDTLKYLAANPDVAAAGINPLDHFLQNGIYEGRSTMGDGFWH